MKRGTASDLLTPGFWCERFVYRSVHADRLASWTALATHSPVRAVRLMGADAREVAAGLPEGERQRVLGEVGGPGQVGAMAALQRGEPCGLALDCAGAWVEWSARPVLFLPLADGAPGTPGPCRADQPTGFGAPLTAGGRPPVDEAGPACPRLRSSGPNRVCPPPRSGPPAPDEDPIRRHRGSHYGATPGGPETGPPRVSSA